MHLPYAPDTIVTLSAEDFSGALLGADDSVMSLEGAHRIEIRTDSRRVRVLRREGASYYQRLTRLL